MFRSLGFGFLCCLAIGSGVAAVSVPVEGRTASEHIRALFEAPAPKRPAAKAKPDRTGPAAAAPAGKAEPTPTRPPRPQENDPTAAERAALDDLLGGKAR